MPHHTHSSSPHPLPPTTEDERVSWLRLLRSRRVGIATFYRLLQEHGSAEAALLALPQIAASAGVTDYAPCPVDVAKAELKAARKAGAQMICIGSPSYPPALLDLGDPPPILWAMGDTTQMDKPMVALVGARNASSLGVRMARKLAQELGEAGYIVVSGLARGIDAAAHEASLTTGTIGVMGGGVDIIYPQENATIAANIAKQGLRLSEAPMGATPTARHFPARNRIIAGLAQALVVVEAAAKSGSLITARNALDLGREVLAVPGHPFDARASGCNMLIRDGAILVRGAQDVIEALSPLSGQQDFPLGPPPAPEKPVPDKRSRESTFALHRQILNRLGPSPVAEDQLIRDMAEPAHHITPALVQLELEGEILRHPGGLLARRS
ncbi:DNA-processing protein DprA [Donghicola mangrovi]|uniref:DNA-protecting protein DprA n=1 Tax=Donghicola mangrovi TaxID=2729614 RepID=A0A850Q584_9RHOB|nr:DNA-processing protein DprA [Donghicola mangrovi]NVO24276.1 DNA-protecting protein DprA [Donghicola mangrovi]